MDISSKLTILYDAPFYIGIIEKQCDDRNLFLKITFGQEPTIPEIYDFILKKYHLLNFYCLTNENNEKPHCLKINPKRIQRIISKEIKNKKSTSKAKDTLKEEYKKLKVIKKAQYKQKNKQEKQEKFQTKQLQKKEKKKGH